MGTNNKPLVRPLDGDRWRLAEQCERLVNGLHITVMRGFEWDGASIPRFAWVFVGTPADDDFLIPSLFHDALYCSKLVSRKRADLIFYKLLRREGVGRFKASILYRAVRVGGRKGYKRGRFSEYVTIVNTNKIKGANVRGGR